MNDVGLKIFDFGDGELDRAIVRLETGERGRDHVPRQVRSIDLLIPSTRNDRHCVSLGLQSASRTEDVGGDATVSAEYGSDQQDVHRK
jgi:hypothetical protein